MNFLREVNLAAGDAQSRLREIDRLARAQLPSRERRRQGLLRAEAEDAALLRDAHPGDIRRGARLFAARERQDRLEVRPSGLPAQRAQHAHGDGLRERQERSGRDRVPVAVGGEELVGEPLEKRLVLAKRLRRGGEIARGRPVQRSERRHHGVPDAVARVRVAAVAGILHVREAVPGEVVQDLRAADLQQRAHDDPPHGRDAAETAQAGAVHKAHENRLRVVVGVVRRRDAGAAPRRRGPREEVIARAARRGLEPLAGARGERGDVGAPADAGDAERFAQLPDEALVPLGLLAAQAVVEVRAHDAELRHRAQQVEQRDAVRPAGDGAEHRRAGREHIVSGRVAADGIGVHSSWRRSTET